MSTRLLGLTLTVLLLIDTSAARAQTLLGQLGTLLTEQGPAGTYVPDAAAAEATTVTVASLLQIELVTVPATSSSGGFVYRLRPDLGLFERATNEFGPFFTERALRGGRGQASIGVTYQQSHFGSLQGADLTSGTFPTNAARFAGAIDPFAVDTLQLDLTVRTTTGFFSYGVTDRLSLGAMVPIVNVRFSGQRMRTVNGQSSLQSRQSGSSTGFGDSTVNARYLVAGSGVRGFSVGGDLRLPTGRQLDLLGTEDAAARVLGIGSWEDGQLAAHVNGGIGVGGVSREIFWAVATTFAATPRVTVIGELMGRRLSELTRVNDVYQPHPVLAGVETMRWLPSERGIHTLFAVTGVKWNLTRSWLLNSNVLIRLTDTGLSARVTPSLSLDYGFER